MKFITAAAVNNLFDAMAPPRSLLARGAARSLIQRLKAGVQSQTVVEREYYAASALDSVSDMLANGGDIASLRSLCCAADLGAATAPLIKYAEACGSSLLANSTEAYAAAYDAVITLLSTERAEQLRILDASRRGMGASVGAPSGLVGSSTLFGPESSTCTSPCPLRAFDHALNTLTTAMSHLGPVDLLVARAKLRELIGDPCGSRPDTSPAPYPPAT